MNEFTKGLLLLGIVVILFLLADIYDIKHFYECKPISKQVIKQMNKE